MEWHEVGVKVSSLKHFTFLTSITLVLLGFIWATVVRQVMCSDAERCVVKSHHLLAKALASQSQTPVSHWYEGEVQPGWVFPWHPPGRSHGFSCHLTAGGKWLDQCSALRAEKAPRKGRASLRRSHNHTKIFFFMPLEQSMCSWWSITCFQLVLLLSFSEKSPTSTHSKRINKTKNHNLQSF